MTICFSLFGLIALYVVLLFLGIVTYNLIMSKETDPIRLMYRRVACMCTENPVPAKVFDRCNCPLPPLVPMPAAMVPTGVSTVVAAQPLPVSAQPLPVVPLVSTQQNFVGGKPGSITDFTSMMSSSRLMMNNSISSDPSYR